MKLSFWLFLLSGIGCGVLTYWLMPPMTWRLQAAWLAAETQGSLMTMALATRYFKDVKERVRSSLPPRE